MIILAIDPGTAQSGWCVYSPLEKIVVESGVSPNSVMLARVQSDGAAINMPMTLAIERVASYGMPVGREVFETCEWIGRFQQAWRDPEAVKLIYRRDVKLHLCGTMKAKDPHVWQALLDKIGPVGTKKSPGPLYGVKSHARSALAVAITAAGA